MDKDHCPCCHNHCNKDSLSCGRGIAYFSEQHDENTKPKTLCENVIDDLRKCGHLLHHNRDLDAEKFLSGLSDDDLSKLHELLTKISNNN